MTFAGSSPVLTRFEYSACLSAMSPPHVKHLTGMSISCTSVSDFKHYKNHYRLHKCQRFSIGVEMSLLPGLSSMGTYFGRLTDICIFLLGYAFTLVWNLCCWIQNQFCKNSFIKFLLNSRWANKQTKRKDR